ncbi:hypothetical protein FN846DRAFT_998022 [Sphaerosporella brunnea]|uniref:Uncharacterized protein n=1 Tax=Sphaerosporella brunnea TaxID=1250544 RepID=A0A5J5F5U7_9PEZI|nr:hypothetical protein FN846DRAFT_998022 [Sphaerosporella brunnea]
MAGKFFSQTCDLDLLNILDPGSRRKCTIGKKPIVPTLAARRQHSVPGSKKNTRRLGDSEDYDRAAAKYLRERILYEPGYQGTVYDWSVSELEFPELKKKRIKLPQARSRVAAREAEVVSGSIPGADSGRELRRWYTPLEQLADTAGIEDIVANHDLIMARYDLEDQAEEDYHLQDLRVHLEVFFQDFKAAIVKEEEDDDDVEMKEEAV